MSETIQTAAQMFRRLAPTEKRALCDSTAFALRDASRHIQDRYVADCTRIDPAFGAGVARSLGFLTTALAA